VIIVADGLDGLCYIVFIAAWLMSVVAILHLSLYFHLLMYLLSSAWSFWPAINPYPG